VLCDFNATVSVLGVLGLADSMQCKLEKLGGLFFPEQGIKLLGLLLTGSTGRRTASRNGLA